MSVNLNDITERPVINPETHSNEGFAGTPSTFTPVKVEREVPSGSSISSQLTNESNQIRVNSNSQPVVAGRVNGVLDNLFRFDINPNSSTDWGITQEQVSRS